MADLQITPAPTEEEAAAIAAVVSVALTSGAPAPEPPPQLSLWISSSRRSVQRAGMQRGPWRMSGRISRRNRV